MNSSKPIDISKSSLVSLKAELSRKQEEVSSVKANKASNYVCPTINPNKKPLPAVKSKFSKNVEKNAEDGSSSVAEENTKALEHSRNVLEIKSKLYDELKEGRLVSEKGRGAEYLVDFTQKISVKGEDASSRENEDDQEQNIFEDDDEDDRPSDPEEDWVDYTDLVGRQRRCLRRDLEAMRARDADSLLPPPPSPPPPPLGCFDDDASAAQRTKHEAQAATAAPHIEAMRRQWRKQEEKLLEKNSVHYEDLLFNEARTHGVGYYAFSTDETERERQMRELERRREETLRRQDDAEGLRARRDMQLKARLQAAKARNRQRLGLPPLAPEQQEDEGKDDVVSEEQSDQNKTDDDSCKKDELEAALKRAAHIRPWDAEKLGLKIVGGDQPAVMSQGEWVDMKRDERISEFAPPEMYNQIRKDATIEPKGDDLSASQPSESRTLFFTSKRPKAADFFKQQQQPQTSTEEYQSPGQSKSRYQTEEQSTNRYQTEEQSTNRYRTQEQSNSSQCSDRFVDDEEPVKRKRTEIPPPLTAEYFGGTSKPKQKPLSKSSGVGESISEGFKYLNEQKKAKHHKRDKGLLDII